MGFTGINKINHKKKRTPTVWFAKRSVEKVLIMKPWAFWGNVRLPFLDQSSGDLGVMEMDGMVKYVFGYYSYKRTPKIMIKVPLTPQIFFAKIFLLDN